MPSVSGAAPVIARRQAWAWAGLAGAMLIAASACGDAGHGRASGQEGSLQVDIQTSPISLDPRFATDAISSHISELIYDSLVRVDERGNFYGDLAETIERPSAERILFRLRHAIRFSDGRELTARDVKFTYDSLASPSSLSPKRAGLGPLRSIEALNDHTVVMATRGPYAPALEMAMYGIVPDGSGVSAPPAGSGPFRLESFLRDESVTLARNPFRPHPPASPSALYFKVVPDPTVCALELAEGICAFAQNAIQPELITYLSRLPDIRVIKSPGSNYQYIAFNFRDPVLRDLRVRRAIAYAIDREAIVDNLLRGTARVACGMLPPENWAYSGAVMRYRYDPAAAASLLDQAGYPRGPDGWRPLRLVYKTTAEGARLGEVFQAMLRRVGIRLEVRANEFATFYNDIQRGNFDLMSLQWVGINGPHHYYMVFDSKMAPPRGLNRGAYSNAEMDRLVERAELTLEPNDRRAIYGQVQKLAAEDLPYVSLWWQDNVAVMNRSVRGYKPYPNGSLLSLAGVTLEQQGGPTPPR